MEYGLDHSVAPAFDRLWHNFRDIKFDTADALEMAFYEETVSALRDFGMARRMRLLASTARFRAACGAC